MQLHAPAPVARAPRPAVVAARQSRTTGAAAAAALFAALAFGAFADASEDAGRASQDAAQDDQARTATHHHIEELTVLAHPLSAEGLSQAAVVLQGDELDRKRGNSIGATVANEPGIHSSAYGEAVGRPVIHGMSGARVRVMEDRIDAMDASVASPDHAVAVEPFIANRVEVIKGPSTLLYGSGAIAGVVDVHTGRIPHEPATAITGKATLRASDNADRVNAAASLDGGGGSVAWHLDAFSRSSDPYDIPGYAESARLRAAEEAEEEEHHDEEEGEDHDDEEHEDEEAYGTLPGSNADGSGGAAGISWVGERGFVGVSVSTLDYDYGLPGGHGHHGEEEHGEEEHEEGDHDEGEDHADEDEHGEGNVVVNLSQTRIDLEAGLTDPFARIDSLNVRFGGNDYEHVEIEPNGETGTVFANDAYEGRVEFVENDGVGMDGVIGLQFGSREFSAIGEEAFVPPVDTGSVGLFWVGQRPLDGFDVEFGARVERTGHQAKGNQDADFTTLSASLGLVLPLGDVTLGLHGGHSARAPTAEELYSNGPHLATESFEVGDPRLDAEVTRNVAATLSWTGERASLTATAYVTAFVDHIYRYATGAEEDGLRVMRYGQSDAVYRGFDVEGRVTLAELGIGTLSATAMFDTVAAELDISGNDRAPRLPPSRFGAGVALDGGRLELALDVTRVFEQDEPAAFELPTDAYDDVRLHVGTGFNVGAADVHVFLQGRNLTDEEQRHHSSFIKDMAPLPGRTIEAGVRLAF